MSAHRARCIAVALFLCLVSAIASAQSLPLQGGWRAVRDGDTPASVTRSNTGVQRFDPSSLHAFPDSAAGTWVLLWPSTGDWPPPPWVIEVDSPGLQTVRFFAPDGAPPIQTSVMSTGDGAWPGHGRVAFPVNVAPPTGEPLRLQMRAHDVIAAPVTFAVRSVGDYLRRDAGWLAFISACLAVMTAMSVMAVFFAIWLRDVAFVYYAIFVLSYAYILALQNGFVAEPLAWRALAQAPLLSGRIATTLSVVFAVLFLSRFAALRRYAPRWRVLLFGFAWVIVALSAAELSISAAGNLGRALINPLLIVGSLALLAASIFAAARGSRYALFFLAGWTPLLVVTALGSAQLSGWGAHWTWSGEAACGAGAFEALILSLGLADRTLALRREHVLARRLADIDPLTGVYNRRAWDQHLLALQDSARIRHQPLALLFLDLDHFKDLNDRHGHDAGDRALKTLARVMHTELREVDDVGRYGGEEFVVALPGTDAERASQVAERIRGRMQAIAEADGDGRTPTVSIGVAALRVNEDTAALLKRADEALYAAKAAGRNRVVGENGNAGI